MARKGIFTYGYDLPVSFDPGEAGQWYASRIDDKRVFPIDEILGYGASPRYLKLAEAFERLVVILRKNRDGWLGFSYGLAMLFNRIWVDPIRIAAGFITEESVHEIEIWNAYIDTTVFWTSVAVIRQPGTDFDTPALPYEIPRFGDIVRDLTIFKAGPPIQDTYWQMTIDGEDFEIFIDGIRIIALEPGMNWQQDLKMNYSFETVMFNTERFHEQRRAMLELSRRGASFKLTLDSIMNHRTFNMLSYGHDKVFGVPIFSEQMYPTALTVGSLAIPISNSNEYLWNMQNRTSFVMIVDHETGTNEIKEILNFTNFNINLKAEIVETFNLSRTIVYPCLFCTLRSVRWKEETDTINEATLQFNEYQSG